MNQSISYFDYDDRDDISKESDTVYYSQTIAVHFTEITFEKTVCAADNAKPCGRQS